MATTPSIRPRWLRALTRGRGARGPQIAGGAVISIRLSDRRDSAAIARLAQLADRPAPCGQALLAVVDGQLRAAHPLRCGEPLSDPFHPSAELRTLLSVRAAQLEGVDRTTARAS